MYSEKNIQNKLLILNKVLEMSLNFKRQKAFRASTFIPDEVILSEKLQSEGISPDNLLEEFEKNYLPFCSNFSTTNFMGFPDSGSSLYGLCGALFADLLQQNLINSTFCAPIATLMEISVIQWLRDIIGYECKNIKSITDVGGIITTGGTTSNAIAMLLARENHVHNTMKNGVNEPTKYKVIIPKGIGHYSISSSLQWIGCGYNLIEVDTINYRYSIPALKKALEGNKGNIMAVILYAGDSRTMTIENINEVCKIVKESDSNIWIHADSCNGFCIAFSNKYKHLIDGIKKCDSITMDPHKMLELPYTVSCLLLREPQKMNLVKTTSDLIMNEELAFGQVTPFLGSKAWLSLKLWFVMKGLGKKGLENLIDKRFSMVQKLKSILESSTDFIILNEVQGFSICFVYIGEENIHNLDISKLNRINQLIHSKMLTEGKYHLHQFPLLDDCGIVKKGTLLYPLRFFSGNSALADEDLNLLITYVRKKALEITQE